MFHPCSRLVCRVFLSFVLALALVGGAPTLAPAGIPFNAIGELVPMGITPALVAAGDFDGDGYSDLIAGDVTNRFSIALHHPDGTFGPSLVFEVGFVPTSPTRVVDLNQDGRADLVMGSPGYQLVALLSHGDGSFTTIENEIVWAPTSLAVGDLNGDGRPDAIAGNGTTLLILLGNGDGTFTSAPDVANANGTRSLQLADFDRDGHPDLAAMGSGQTVSVWIGNGDGTFESPTLWNSTVYASHMFAGDVDGDGKPDLICIGSYYGLDSPSVMRGNGDGTFGEAIVSDYQYYDWGFTRTNVVTAGDMGEDGRIEIVAVRPFNDQPGFEHTNLKLIRGDANGHLLDRDHYNDVVIQPMPPVDPYPWWDVPAIVGTMADLGGDGRADIAVAGANGDNVLVLSSLPDGSFQQPVVHSFRNPYYYVALGLLQSLQADADGHPDLLTAYTNGSGGVTVSLARTSSPGAGFTLTFYPLAGAAGDLDGDGIKDLVLLNPQSSENSFSTLGSAGGPYGPLVPFVAGPLTSIQIADCDGDHHGDLVATDGSGSLRRFPGNGDGTFGTSVPLLSDATGRARIADLNNDAQPDIVCPTSQGVTVLIGNGSGTFQPRVDLAPGGAVTALDVGSLDGNGAPDLAVSLGNGIAVWLGTGSGSFGPASFTPGATASDIAIGDWNSDGLGDLAFTSTGITCMLGHGDGSFGPRRIMAPYMSHNWWLANLSPDATGKAKLVTAGGPGMVFLSQRSDVTDPVAHVISPNGGETAVYPRYFVFSWSASDDVGVTGVDLRLSRHGAAGPWEVIANNQPSSGTYGWRVTSPLTENALLRITAHDASGNFANDDSDQPFTIGAPTSAESGPLPNRFALGSVTPSPARSIARFTFDVARAGEVRLDVVDVAGRIVTTLRRESLAPGRYSEAWRVTPGRDATPAGVYFLRLTAANVSLSQKVLLVP